MQYVWAIVLFNFLHVQQAVLTGPDGKILRFADRNACQNELIARKLADISVVSVHGECKQIALGTKLPRLAVPK